MYLVYCSLHSIVRVTYNDIMQLERRNYVYTPRQVLIREICWSAFSIVFTSLITHVHNLFLWHWVANNIFRDSKNLVLKGTPLTVQCRSIIYTGGSE